MLREFKDILSEVVQAILPVTVTVLVLQFALLSMPLKSLFQLLIGAGFIMLGLALFLYGIRIGLLPMGEAIGSQLPNWGSALVVVSVAFVLGFAVTVAEPDVRVLAFQVDMVSEGYIGRNLLVSVVALGIAIFVALAMLRIILGIPMAYILIAGYSAIMVLSFFTPPQFVPVAFDAGGVTTGPMTVPFILALGIGLTSVLSGKSNLSNSFGLIGLASIGPVLAVLLLGVIFA